MADASVRRRKGEGDVPTAADDVLHTPTGQDPLQLSDSATADSSDHVSSMKILSDLATLHRYVAKCVQCNNNKYLEYLFIRPNDFLHTKIFQQEVATWTLWLLLNERLWSQSKSLVVVLILIISSCAMNMNMKQVCCDDLELWMVLKSNGQNRFWLISKSPFSGRWLTWGFLKFETNFYRTIFLV